MYTEPTEFTNFKDRSGTLRAAILRIYDGTDYWFFGNVEMDIANNETGDTSTYHVYPLLDFDGIVESADFLRKTWAMVRLNVKLHNLPYRINASGNWICPHDDLVDAIKGSEVNLYLIAGPNVTSLDDCLLRFHGIVAGSIMLNEEELAFSCVDRSRLYRVFLPPETVESSGLWPSCPEKSRDKRIPILYGTFDQDFLSPATHNGLVRGIIVQETPPKWVIGKTATNTKIYIGTASRSNFYFEGDNVTFSTTGGYTMAQQDAVDGIYRGSKTLNLNETVEASLYYNRTSYPVVNPANAHDDTTAVATVQDNFSDNGTIMRGVAAWGIDNHDLLLTMISDETASIRILCEFRDINMVGGLTATDMNLGLAYGPTEEAQHITAWPIFVNQLGDSGWLYVEPLIAADYAEDIFANDVHLMFNVQTSSGGDGSTNNQNLCTIDELRVKLETNIKRWTDAWFEGIAFGDTNDHHAPDIIKDILETYCGLESKYIISANFSDAKRTAYGPMRVCLSSANAGYSDVIIRNIIEQSNISFFWNARSEPKCVHILRYGSETVTIDATITYADIIEKSVKLSKSDFSIDELVVYSRWQEEFGRFRDEDTYNAPVEGAGTGFMEVRWKFVNGNAVGYLGAGYVSNSNALWAFDRTIVELETKGFKYANLEIGDLIELDYNTFDPRIKAFTESWQDKVLIVIGLVQRANSTVIKVMETSFVET